MCFTITINERKYQLLSLKVGFSHSFLKIKIQPKYSILAESTCFYFPLYVLKSEFGWGWGVEKKKNHTTQSLSHWHWPIIPPIHHRYLLTGAVNLTYWPSKPLKGIILQKYPYFRKNKNFYFLAFWKYSNHLSLWC